MRRLRQFLVREGDWPSSFENRGGDIWGQEAGADDAGEVGRSNPVLDGEGFLIAAQDLITEPMRPRQDAHQAAIGLALRMGGGRFDQMTHLHPHPLQRRW